MNERLLQFIWQFQYFEKNDLDTEQGQKLQIIFSGLLNTNQGPDFLDARIKLDKEVWAGNIELHCLSSDWKKHNHQHDKNYNNIVLHVVWQNDETICDNLGNEIPTLILSHRVPKVLLQRYESLMHNQGFCPCESYLPYLDSFKWNVWKERLAIERLQRKSKDVDGLLVEAGNHWEEVFWWMLAKNFGAKVNAGIFENIAKSIPVNIIGRHKNQIHQLEAMLFGQAGLLQRSFTEDYPLLLQREYRFLQKKYKWQPVQVSPHLLRMRPANFPTIRLAQLAMLIHNSSHLFSIIKEESQIEKVSELLQVTANDYWHYHYLFDEPTEFKPKQLGSQMVDNVLINTIIPILFAYGNNTGNQDVKDKGIRWLSQLKPEKNTITSKWITLGVLQQNALESQALIELKNNYCNEIRCLDCAVGNGILKG